MVGTVGNKSWASALRHRYKRASSEALFFFFYCYPATAQAGHIVQNMVRYVAAFGFAVKSGEALIRGGRRCGCGFAERDVTVIRVRIAAGVVGVGHDAHRADPPRFLAEGAAVILDDVARDFLPVAEPFTPGFDDDHADARGVSVGNHRFARRLVAPDVHQRGVGQLLPGEQADAVEQHAVLWCQFSHVAVEADHQPRGGVLEVFLRIVGLRDQFIDLPAPLQQRPGAGIQRQRVDQAGGRRSRLRAHDGFTVAVDQLIRGRALEGGEHPRLPARWQDFARLLTGKTVDAGQHHRVRRRHGGAARDQQRGGKRQCVSAL